ncbi:MAG: hypothetical protein CTY29_10110 [Methylobacter sp.]|nr:MAG: hypothetical protein CTY29_10110 [Methylobacter sp.]
MRQFLGFGFPSLVNFSSGNGNAFGKASIDFINGLHQGPVFAGQLIITKLEHVDLTGRGLRLYSAELDAAFLVAIAGPVYPLPKRDKYAARFAAAGL